MVDIQRRIDRLTNECEALKKQIRELKNVIDDPFDGSEDELKLLITNFQRDQEKKKHELQDVSHFSLVSLFIVLHSARNEEIDVRTSIKKTSR